MMNFDRFLPPFLMNKQIINRDFHKKGVLGFWGFGGG